MSGDRFNLSPKDRLVLVNQYLILEKLFSGEQEEVVFREKRKIVENGYALHYSDLNCSIAGGGLSEEECMEVMDILDMHRVLDYSVDRYYPERGAEREKIENDVVFNGFDGNNEAEYLGYARFLMFELERWQEVLKGRPGFDLNSHCMVLEMYRRMLSEWGKSSDKYNLNREDIVRILAARIHPENR